MASPDNTTYSSGCLPTNGRTVGRRHIIDARLGIALCGRSPGDDGWLYERPYQSGEEHNICRTCLAELARER